MQHQTQQQTETHQDPARPWKIATLACGLAMLAALATGLGTHQQPANAARSGAGSDAGQGAVTIISIAADDDKLYRLRSDGIVEFTKAKAGDVRSARGYANWRVLPIDPDL